MNTTTIESGTNVRHHSCEHGWRFGVVIGRHVKMTGVGALGIDCATVRFHTRARRDSVEYEESVPVFRLEQCDV